MSITKDLQTIKCHLGALKSKPPQKHDLCQEVPWDITNEWAHVVAQATLGEITHEAIRQYQLGNLDALQCVQRIINNDLSAITRRQHY